MCSAIITYHFRHHEHGALSIYNSVNVTVKNCTFHNNTSDGNFTMKPYQGSAGGLSIGYNDTHLRRESINIHIIKCNFSSNAAVLPSNLTLSSTTEALLHKKFPGRGGALTVLISTCHPLNFVLNDSIMMDNSAHFGASIYCVIINGYYNQTYVFANNVFMNNTAPIGGGLTFANLVGRPVKSIIHSLIYNCTFIDNTATSEVSGAANAYALYGLPNNIVIFRDCKFYNNNAEMYGGAVDIASYNFFENREEVFPVHFINWLVSYI